MHPLIPIRFYNAQATTNATTAASPALANVPCRWAMVFPVPVKATVELAAPFAEVVALGLFAELERVLELSEGFELLEEEPVEPDELESVPESELELEPEPEPELEVELELEADPPSASMVGDTLSAACAASSVNVVMVRDLFWAGLE